MMLKVNYMRNDAGMSLITAIIIVTVISFLGVVIAALTSSRTATTVDRLSAVRAQFIAEGGLEWGIRQYKAVTSCAAVPSTTNNLGNGQFTVTVMLGDGTTTCAGATVSTGQACIRSTGAIAGAARIVEQIATCPGGGGNPAIATTSAGGDSATGGTVYCGTGSCKYSWWPKGYTGDCDCIQENSTATFPPVSVPVPAPPAPKGICEYNNMKTSWDGGTYYCASLHLNSKSEIRLNGPVTIYTSNFEMNGASLNMGKGSLVTNLIVMVTASGYAQLNSSSQFKGLLYSPGVNVGIYGGADIYGGVAANTVKMDSSSAVTWDITAGSAAPNYSSLTGGGGGGGGSETSVTWRETPP
jgi:Tfp pilus assembly protein PilX